MSAKLQDLKNECVRLHLKTSMFSVSDNLIVILAISLLAKGKKNMARRILKHRAAQIDPTRLASRIASLHRPTLKYEGNDQPVINAHYTQQFNVIDNFDKLLSATRWPYDIHKQGPFFLISCIQIISVNIAVAWAEQAQDPRDPVPRPDMRAQLEQIANALLQK